MNKLTKAFIAISILFIGVVLLIWSNSGQIIEEPSIEISVGGQSVKPIYYGNMYNESREDIERFLSFPFENDSWEDIPHVSIGDEVVITLKNFDTEEFTIYDDLLTDQGKFLYTDKASNVFSIKPENGEVRFEIPPNLSLFLSSNSDSYQPGRVFRAFTLRAEIHESDFAFAFVVRTNPK